MHRPLLPILPHSITRLDVSSSEKRLDIILTVPVDLVAKESVAEAVVTVIVGDCFLQSSLPLPASLSLLRQQ